MTLNRLGRRERMAMVEHVTGGKALPQALLEQIVERTDGVPLFVEELTKAVLESEELEQPMQQLAIPTTLQASLMSRVDRLGSAREVLQIGAAIGREFSYELLAAVAGLPDQVLQDALARLIEAELLYARGTPPNATYAFKHALVQDAAYSTMLRTRRQQLHGAIAAVLEKRFPDSAAELLAQQFEGAGRAEQAIRYWRQAGDRDLRRFALKEAVAHYSQCVTSRHGDAGGKAARWHSSSTSASGSASPQQISDRPDREGSGRALPPGAGAQPRHARQGPRTLPRHLGRLVQRDDVGPHRGGLRLADELLAIARELDNPDLLLEAYHAQRAGAAAQGGFRRR